MNSRNNEQIHDYNHHRFDHPHNSIFLKATEKLEQDTAIVPIG